MGPLGGIYRTRKPAFKTLLTTNIPKKSHFCKYIPGIENAWLKVLCVCVIYNNEWKKQDERGLQSKLIKNASPLWEIVCKSLRFRGQMYPRYGQKSAVLEWYYQSKSYGFKVKLYYSSIKCLSNIIYECDDLNLDSNAFHGQMDRTLFLLL